MNNLVFGNRSCSGAAVVAIGAAFVVGLATAGRFLLATGYEGVVLKSFLWGANAPGIACAVIPFALLGGFRYAHGGDAVIFGAVIEFVGNGIGYGVVAYFVLCRRWKAPL